MKVFIDTGAFIALFAQSEKYHKASFTQYNKYLQNRARLFTSYYVLNELYTRLIYDFGKTICEKAINLLNKTILSGDLNVLDVDQTIFKKAENILLKFAEHKISMTDATTFILYKDLSLDEIFTLDNDFKKLGATISPS